MNDLNELLSAGNDLDSVACNARCYDLNVVDRAEAEEASRRWRETRDDFLIPRAVATQSEVCDAVMKAVSARLHTDLTDYYNWQGIRDMGRHVYFMLIDGEQAIGEAEKMRLNTRPARYRRVFWRLYWRVR